MLPRRAFDRPLFRRMYRRRDLHVQTADAPLTLEDLRATYTDSPCTRKARFESDAPTIEQERTLCELRGNGPVPPLPPSSASIFGR